MKTSGSAPACLADCVRAAQADAERFYGNGPVPHWRPAFSRARWVGGATLAAVAMALAAWLWDVPAAPDIAPADSVAADVPMPSARTMPIPAANEPVSPVGADTACANPGCEPAPAPFAHPAPDPFSAAALPPDLDAWALDPQTIPVSFAMAPPGAMPSLHNTPVIPDEADPTPAEESQPDEEPGGGLDE